MIFTSHAYTSPADLHDMCDLVTAARPREWLTDFPSIANLDEATRQEEVAASLCLWRDPAGGLVAFAYINEGNLVFEMLPGSWDVPNLGDNIVAYGVRYLLSRSDSPETLDTSCRAEDAPRIALLERNGFERAPFFTLELGQSLTGRLPEPFLPEGFMIRPLDGKQELEAVVALHQVAFGTQNLTIEARRAWMGGNDYDPALDLVAVAPDGRLAGYCFGQFNRAENELSGEKVGYTDPVAIHPDFQRKGLAHALLLAGMRLLQERGLEFARIGTSSENIAMQKAAKAAGFHVESRRIWLMKSLYASPAIETL
jgi:mycothiol synthase